MPHTLEYSYSMPSPTPVAPAPLHPWFLATEAAPMLADVQIEKKDEVDVVAAPGIGALTGSRLAGRRGAQPLFSAAPGTSTPPPPATRAEAAARMKAQALPGPPPAEALPTPTFRRLAGRPAVDRHPGIRAGSWNPAVLGLPSPEVLNIGRVLQLRTTAAAAAPWNWGIESSTWEEEARDLLPDAMDWPAFMA